MRYTFGHSSDSDPIKCPERRRLTESQILALRELSEVYTKSGASDGGHSSDWLLKIEPFFQALNRARSELIEHRKQHGC